MLAFFSWTFVLIYVGRCFIVQFSSVTQSCPTLCHPMDCSTPGLPVHHQLLEFAQTHVYQTHVYQVGDAIQPSRPLSSPCSPAFNLSQHQGLFQWVSSLHQVAKVLEFQLQHQPFQWIVKDWFPLGLTGLISLQSKVKSIIKYLKRERDLKATRALGGYSVRRQYSMDLSYNIA